MPRVQRFAFLCLLAALAAPALILLPRTAHPFEVGPAVGLPVLAWLAAGLAWLSRGAPWKRVWAWLLGGLGLAWPLLWLLTRPWTANLLKKDLLPLLPWLQRGTLLGFGLVLAWEAGRDREGQALDPWVRRLGLGLAGLWCLSGALSLRPDASLAALLNWGCYFLVFGAAYALAQDPAGRRKLVLLLLWVGALNTAYAGLQFLGLDPLPWNQSFAGRASGFFGNPNFLGGHLALLLPLALALALDERGTPRAQAGRWLLAGLLALGLLLTQTRGAWGGAVAGCGLVLWLAARQAPGLLRRQRTPLLAGLLLGAALGGLTLATQPQARERIFALLAGRDVEAGRRAFLMTKTLQLAAEHPALGVGPGNFRLWFPSVQVRGLEPAAYGGQPYVVSAHSHNDLLQMAADAGWPAAGLWLLLLAAVFRAQARALRPQARPARVRPESLLVLGCLGGLAALSVHGLANFPFLILSTQATAWALAAVSLRTTDPSPAGPAPRGRGNRLALLGVMVGAVALAGLGARRLLKDQFWWVGQGELGLKNTELASATLFRALDFDRREDRLWVLHGRAEFERDFIWNSIGSLREALRLNPYDAEAAVRLGVSLVENKQYEEAETVLNRVAGYAPNFVDLWEPLAAALYQQQKIAEAVKAYDWMIYYRVKEEAAVANKAAAQGSLGQLPQALLTLRSAEQRLPHSGKIQLNLAITYLKMGMKREAREAWRKAEKLSPSDPQVDQMREVLR